MDCLVNMRLRKSGVICEVQIVDRLLLTVRAEWGAHRSYNTYRAASELLECTGHSAELQEAMDAVNNGSSSASSPKFRASSRPRMSAGRSGNGGGGDDDNDDDDDDDDEPAMEAWLREESAAEKKATAARRANYANGGEAGADDSGSSGGGGGGAQVHGLALTPDGTTLVTASDDQALRVWGLRDGSLRLTISPPDGAAVSSLAVTPDGNHVVAACSDRVARVWSLRTGVLQQTCTGHSGPVAAVAVTPDGATLITGSFDRTARLWPLEQHAGAGARLTTAAAATAAAAAAAMGTSSSSSSAAIPPPPPPSAPRATAGQQQQQQQAAVRVLRGHDAPVRAVACTPDGTMMVTGSDDRTAALWSLADGLLAREFKGHDDGVDAVAVTADGAALVTRSNDHAVRLWTLATGEMLHLFRSLGFVRAIATVALAAPGIGSTPSDYSDLHHLLTGSRDQRVRVVSLQDWSVRLQITCSGGADGVADGGGGIQALVVTPDGASFVTGGGAAGASVWSLKDGSLQRRFEF